MVMGRVFTGTIMTVPQGARGVGVDSFYTDQAGKLFARMTDGTSREIPINITGIGSSGISFVDNGDGTVTVNVASGASAGLSFADNGDGTISVTVADNSTAQVVQTGDIIEITI